MARGKNDTHFDSDIRRGERRHGRDDLELTISQKGIFVGCWI
jgi:hypothetical protein